MEEVSCKFLDNAISDIICAKFLGGDKNLENVNETYRKLELRVVLKTS